MADFGMNMALVGNKNRATILNYINKMGAASRKEIAEVTGLTPAAVTQISQGLIRDGILEETGQVSGEGAGRKQVMLHINYNCGYVLSVNIERSHTVVAICNLKGEVQSFSAGSEEELLLQKIDTDTGVEAETFLEVVADKCRTLLDTLSMESLEKVTGVSIGVPGIVDALSGKAIRAYGIWEDEVPVCDILARRLEDRRYPKFTFCITNNVNAFAQASSLYGIGKNYDNMLVIKWGPGVGGTIIIDNKVYDGRHGKAAEIGHYIVRKNGAVCNCGRRGCLETMVSFTALNQVMPFEAEEFAKAYEVSGLETKKIIDEVIDLFAKSIVNTVTVLAPDRVVLCGFMFREEKTRQMLLERIREYDSMLAEKRILYTELAEREEYIGPVAAYVKKIIEG